MDPYQKSHELSTEFYSSYPPEVIEHEFINYLIRNKLEYEKDLKKYELKFFDFAIKEDVGKK